MILLIDPISSSSVQRAQPLRADELIKKPAKSSSLDSSTRGESRDQVQISFNLQGDLDALRQSVAAVQSEVKAQLQRRFGAEGELSPEAKRFAVPEDASANQLLEFFSPENTSERIVGFATGYFSNFAQNNPDLSEEEQVDEFSNLISGAIEQGFEEAREVLGDLSGFETISKNIEKTYNLVVEKIEEFRRENFNALGIEPEPEETEETETAEEDAIDPLA